MPIVTENYATSDTRKYKTHVLPRLNEIEEWIKQGYTDYSICKTLDICHQTWIDYKKSQVELIETYTRARAERNNLVMNAMFKKSTGITQKIDQQKVTKDGDVIDFTETIYVAPDVNAADLYLRNNSEDYKSAKADAGNLTLIQNNFQLPQLQAQLQSIDEQIKRLESGTVVEVEVIEDK